MSATDVAPAAPTLVTQKGVAVSGGPLEITGLGDAPGDAITLYNGSTVVGSGTVAADGSFDVVTTGDFADGVYTLTATDTGAGGLASAPATVTATVQPPPPVLAYVRGTPTNNRTLFLLGIGVTGDTITFYADGNSASVGSGVVGAQGVFAIITTATFPEGDHVITATQTDAAGAVSAVSAPLAVVVDPSPVTLFEPKAALDGGTMSLTGRGEAGDTVAIYADGAAAPVATAVVDSSGVFAATTTVTFTDGEHSFTGTETNAQGLTSPLSAPKLLPVLPPSPTLKGAVGLPAVGGPIVLTGTGQAGDTVNIYYALAAKKVSLGSGVVAADGTYTVTLTSPLAQGGRVLDARETDTAGVASGYSAEAIINVLPAGPTITAVVGQPVVGGKIEITGTAAAGAALGLYVRGSSTLIGWATANAAGVFTITTKTNFSDGVVALVARQQKPGQPVSGFSAVFYVDVPPPAPKLSAQVGQAVSGSEVALSGTGVAGDTITVYADGGTTPVGSTTVGASKTYSVTTSAPFADGVHTFSTTQTDTAGVSSAASNILTTTVLPAPPTITGAVGSAVAGQAFQIAGTGAPGDQINLYAGNAATSVGSATVAASGAWTVTMPTTVADGVHQYSATQTDAQHEVSKASASATVSVAPMAPSLTGLVAPAAAGANLQFSGTGEAGDIVTLYSNVDSSAVAYAMVGSTGTFDITTERTYAAGAYTFTATETDAASLNSPVSASLPVTVTIQGSAQAAAVFSQYASAMSTAATPVSASAVSSSATSSGALASAIVAPSH